MLFTAVKVSGIKANKDWLAEFIFDNLMIQNIIIHMSHEYKAKNSCSSAVTAFIREVILSR
jgi:hypothetical protein